MGDKKQNKKVKKNNANLAFNNDQLGENSGEGRMIKESESCKKKC